MSSNNHQRQRYGGPMACLPSNRERRFPSLEDEKMNGLACAIIEQAVLDWRELDYGRIGYISVSNYHALVYRSDVESFFRGKWFEFLLSYALPNFDPAAFRKEMRLEEVTA